MAIRFEDLDDQQKLVYIDAEICRWKEVRRLIGLKSASSEFVAVDVDALDNEIARLSETKTNPAFIVEASKQQETE